MFCKQGILTPSVSKHAYDSKDEPKIFHQRQLRHCRVVQSQSKYCKCQHMYHWAWLYVPYYIGWCRRGEGLRLELCNLPTGGKRAELCSSGWGLEIYHHNRLELGKAQSGCSETAGIEPFRTPEGEVEGARQRLDLTLFFQGYRRVSPWCQSGVRCCWFSFWRVGVRAGVWC